MAQRPGGFAVLAFIPLAMACADGSGPAPVVTEPSPAVLASTYGQLQRNVFDRQCVVCHSANGSAVRQSGLNLEAPVSYQNLIGTRPVNTTAQSDGMVRVMPGNPGVSLLFTR